MLIGVTAAVFASSGDLLKYANRHSIVPLCEQAKIKCSLGTSLTKYFPLTRPAIRQTPACLGLKSIAYWPDALYTLLTSSESHVSFSGTMPTNTLCPANFALMLLTRPPAPLSFSFAELAAPNVASPACSIEG